MTLANEAFELLRPQAVSRFVLFCDHASNRVPPELNNLCLPPAELERHIAWDIGAAGITHELSKIFDAPAVLSTMSRLVIDCNRHLTAADLIPLQSDGVTIPGNASVTAEERATRFTRWFDPYHAAVESMIETRIAQGTPPIVVSIHSMTGNLAGVARPWQIALSSHTDRTLADPLLAALRRPGDIVVGDNQPYNLDPAFDFSTPFHALRRNLAHIQVEFRQDEVTDEASQIHWATRFATALSEALPR